MLSVWFIGSRKASPTYGSDGYKGVVEPYTAPPVDAFLRNAELQLAAWIVMLVVVPGAVQRVNASPRPPASTSPRTLVGQGKPRHVRAPRSC